MPHVLSLVQTLKCFLPTSFHPARQRGVQTSGNLRWQGKEKQEGEGEGGQGHGRLEERSRPGE